MQKQEAEEPESRKGDIKAALCGQASVYDAYLRLHLSPCLEEAACEGLEERAQGPAPRCPPQRGPRTVRQQQPIVKTKPANNPVISR